MAADPFDDVLNDLSGQIHAKLERREIAELRFARVGTAQAILQAFNLRRFFQSLVPPGDSVEAFFGSGVTDDILIARTTDRDLCNFLAILIYAPCGIASARAFTKTLLASPSESWPIVHGNGRRIDQLPANRHQLEQLFGRHSLLDIKNFLDTQPCFCPIILLKGEDVRVTDRKKHRLPYSSDEVHIGTGSYGEVYRVEIAEGHTLNKRTSTANTTPTLLARKDFKKSREFQDEYEIIKQILYAPDRSDNILTTYGSLQLDDDTFSLFMPLAHCDLRTWMIETPRPASRSQRADIIRCASELASGLEFLHSKIKNRDGNRLVCFHMDLKPANILVFDSRHPGQLIWKISDFGMSRVKVTAHNSEYDGRDKDMSSLFQRKQTDAAASGTMNLRLDGTYLAPESSTAMRKMNKESDNWSLGCVVSVIFTFLEEGQRGINEYSDAREEESRRQGCGSADRFFLLSKSLKKAKNHPGVKDQHRYLIRKAGGRSIAEREVVRRTLKYVEDSVLLLDSSGRASAQEISDLMSEASADYRNLDHPHRGQTTSAATVRRWARLKWIIPFARQVDNGTEARVHRWPLPGIDILKGSDVSPNGRLIACWTDRHIVLYGPQSFVPHEGKALHPVAEHQLEGSVAWKSIKLTEKYLIASTKGSRPSIYLFDLEGGNLSGPNFQVSYEITLPVGSFEGLHEVAISPGGGTLACMVPRDTHSSWVFYAPIMDLVHHRIDGNDSAAGSLSSNKFKYNIGAKEPWQHFLVKSSAGDVTHLLFPSDGTLCAVAQPATSASSQEHCIRISSMSLGTKKVTTLPIENPLNTGSRDLDSSNSGNLFTALAALNHERAYAIMLYEKELLVRNFEQSSEVFDGQTSFKNYQIVELLAGGHDPRVFALGSKSGNNMMLLLELPLPHLLRNGSVREIAKLPDFRYKGKFSAKLSATRSTAQQRAGRISGVSRDEEGYDASADGEGVLTFTISVFALSQPAIYTIQLPTS
ncbi:Uu.00g114260.m01.CDS01 [Anthostomella pinea]|uniref:Uu.00g114260.m01.CDS01 n=1 Tax=Anthostomella pinea TaxID=933095 RepID=A0AAI8VFP5_9PEZI|nr:Uu.00g114260.m01.CDS01 [Anthostomella pinea]